MTDNATSTRPGTGPTIEEIKEACELMRAIPRPPRKILYVGELALQQFESLCPSFKNTTGQTIPSGIPVYIVPGVYEVALLPDMTDEKYGEGCEW